MLAGILKEEAGLANAACAFDADEGLAPVNLIHECSTDGEVGVFDQIGVCSEEGLHFYNGNRFVFAINI